MKLILPGLIALAAAAAGCQTDGRLDLFSSVKPASQDRDEYTILLYMLATPDHTVRIQTYKDQTERDTHWTGLFVVDKPDHSNLCWGRYSTPAAAARDLAKAKKYRSPTGVLVYAKAMVLPLPGKEPGPPEWNLRNAKGAYTLVIATFYDVPDANYFGRKANAVEYCRQLRQGGQEAYYLHGPVVSSVTIGTFPESALGMANIGGRLIPEIRDPGMLAAQRQHPHLAVNGRQQITLRADASGQAQKIPDPSYPDRIPQGEDDLNTNAFSYSGNP